MSRVACHYCGGRHDTAVQVRACWERAQRASDAAPPQPAPAAATAAPVPSRPVLGRSVVVAPGGVAPAVWAGCDRVGASVTELEEAWRERRPLVIEVGEEPPADEVETAPVWSLAPSFAFPGERLAHAVHANSLDARGGTLRWRWAEEAVRLGARAGGPADVVLPDGRPAYCDGGPTQWSELPGVALVPRVTLLAGALAPLGPNDTDAVLAPDQLAAVTTTGAAARVIAPAGSGKTRVLTERARHLLRRWQLPGRAVTLVAFNKRAAEEMEQRTPDLPELQVRTLNALGLALVNGATRVKTIEEREVRAILDTLVDLPRRANTDPAAAWIEALSAVRLGLEDPRKVEAEFAGDVDGLGSVLDRYRRLLADRNAVDFDEQIYRALEILLCDAGARRRARAACRVLLVDEFQDLTPAHLLLVRLLAGPEGAVFGVGDDDQTIYGYAGASPEWLIGYRRYFPSAAEHALQVNYRCPSPVVHAARTLLTHNRRRVAKEVQPAPGREVRSGALEVAPAGPALAATTAAVRALVGAGARPADVAVLTRVTASLAPVQVALLEDGVPVRAVVGESYLDRSAVQAALAWLRLAVAAPSELAARDLALAARRPSRGLSPRVVEWAGEQRDVRGLIRLAERMNDRDGKKIRGFVDDLELVRDVAASAPTAKVLRAVRDRVGLDGAMHLLEGARRRVDRSALTDDLDALVALAERHPDAGGFEHWLRRSLRDRGDEHGVVLATIHAVKGREWPHVVVHAVTAGLLPHRLSGDVEEERRVFHVALTRCSESCTVVPGEAPSPFLAELTEKWTPARAAPRPPSATPAPARQETGREATVEAVVGSQLEWGGHAGKVVATDQEGAVLRVDAVTMRLGYGAWVRSGGRLGRLVPEAPPAVVVDRAREGLRAWRLERSRKLGKPAFVIFSDATLDAVAAAMPGTIEQLAAIKGIGPAKLQAYGEELLAVLASVRT